MSKCIVMTDSPNIVLVTMDTARAQNLSCYGYERNTSPFLDKLAEENVKYERAYSQANWTLPSHASIFSGKYISEHSIVDKNGFQDIEVLMEELDDQYTKIGVTNVPFLSESFGFDEYFDFFSYNSDKDFYDDLEVPENTFKKSRKSEKYYTLISYLLKNRRFDKLFEGVKTLFDKWFLGSDSGAEFTNEKAEEFLREKNDEDPFFMFLNYFEPHAPYRPPFPYSHKFIDNKFRWLSLISSSNEKMRKYLSPEFEPSDELIEDKKALYDAEIRYLDSKLEELHSFIREKHPNTIFIFTSDHGEYFYEYGNVHHHLDLHDEVTHVPMIQDFPGDKKRTIERPVELRGLKDHILKLSEGEFDVLGSKKYAVSEFRGASENDLDSIERLSGEELPDDLREKLSRSQASIRSSRFRLTEYEGGEHEIFSGDQQPDADISKARDELVGRVNLDMSFGEKEDMSIDDEKVKEKLEDLGYI